MLLFYGILKYFGVKYGNNVYRLSSDLKFLCSLLVVVLVQYSNCLTVFDLMVEPFYRFYGKN